MGTVKGIDPWQQRLGPSVVGPKSETQYFSFPSAATRGLQKNKKSFFLSLHLVVAWGFAGPLKKVVDSFQLMSQLSYTVQHRSGKYICILMLQTNNNIPTVNFLTPTQNIYKYSLLSLQPTLFPSGRINKLQLKHRGWQQEGRYN